MKKKKMFPTNNNDFICIQIREKVTWGTLLFGSFVHIFHQ